MVTGHLVTLYIMYSKEVQIINTLSMKHTLPTTRYSYAI